MRNSKHLILYTTLICFFFSIPLPSKLSAEIYPAFCTEEQRNKAACILAIATAVVLVGGIAYWGAVGGHCSSSCSSSSSSPRGNPALLDEGGPIVVNDAPYYSYGFSDNDVASFSAENSISGVGGVGGDVNIFNPFDDDGAAFSARQRKQSRSKGSAVKATKTQPQVSGYFYSTPNMALVGGGSMTPFVVLPDGSTTNLGTVSLSNHGVSMLAYGPFDQAGTYSFGVHVDGAALLQDHAKIGHLEVEVNEMRMQTHDFVILSRGAPDADASLFTYTLSNE